MRKTRMFFLFLFAFLIVAYAVIQYGFYDPKLAGLVQFKLKSPDFHVTPWVYFLYAHIATGALALLIGPFQIFRKQSNNIAQRIHRRLGKIYVACIMLSGLINIYLSMFASGGWVARTGFFTMDLIWMYTTYMAVAKIMRKDIQAHRNWMLRSYAITFAAVTLRLYQVPLMILFGEFEPAYRISAWLCWVANLLVIELVIRKSAVKTHAVEV
ncbi:DUF2306 domain-containing protein [Paenibacillus alginolyticus]|uniref:DUF2306 domain-containing protein n=1 Tax=Paenibacillus alginolyticus TaxID=59839 RepID=UPI00042568B2|nr:DUF2306 domain-containing protein [Paenibacillus alginolyticus]MCY9670053.1 DUF2306 domain-containing protein [Paenibacillus alginolyticus]